MPDPHPDALPNCFIVGAPKCGTTSLFAWLAQHPQFHPSPVKEPFHFGEDLHNTIDWVVPDRGDYLRLFEPGRNLPVRGESTAFNLFSRTAAAEIRAFNPHAKIIILLRDPVRQIYSQHRHFVRILNEPEPDLERALSLEADRAAGRADTSYGFFPEAMQYRRTARYREQIERYHAAFGGPRQPDPDLPPGQARQVRIWLLDDLVDHPQIVFSQVCEYLGIDPAFQPDTTPQNVEAEKSQVRNLFIRRMLRQHHGLRRFVGRTMRPISRPIDAALASLLGSKIDTRRPMPPRLEARLRDEFREEVRWLGDLLQRDLESQWWGTAPETEGP